MIFAVSVGSSGTGDERYSLYIPFVLAPGNEIGKGNGMDEFSLGDKTAHVYRLERHYALTVGTFDSLDDAKHSVERIKACLLWFSVQHRIGVNYERKLSSPSMYDKPNEPAKGSPLLQLARDAEWVAIDGHYDSHQMVVYPEHKRLMRWESGQATLRLGIGLERISHSMAEAAGFPGICRVCELPKLRLAMELYGASFFELSKNAKFITLVSCLEALTPDFQISEAANEALDAAKEKVDGARSNYDKETDDWNEINRLMSRIGGMRREAIGTSMRKYVLGVASRENWGEQAVIEQQLKAAYTVRSSLLHDGEAETDELDEHLQFLSNLVPRLLTAVFKHETHVGGEAQ